MVSQAIFAQKYGPWAFVTGAASGLGKEFTNQLAALHLNILAIDVQEEKLQEQAAYLQKKYEVQVKALPLDLSGEHFLDAVIEASSDIEIGLLANVAGLSYVGEFLDIPLEHLLKQVEVNCRAPLQLSHHFGKLMRERGHGGIIFISSASAFQGTALVANYAATKAYNLILAEGLWEELRSQGVDVLGFAPGSTNTPGFHKDNPQYKSVRMTYMEPEPTVSEAIEALGSFPSRVAGGGNRAAMFLTNRILPRKQTIKLFGDSMRKLYSRQ